MTVRERSRYGFMYGYVRYRSAEVSEGVAGGGLSLHTVSAPVCKIPTPNAKQGGGMKSIMSYT